MKSYFNYLGVALRASGIRLGNSYKVEVNPMIALELVDTLLGLFCHTTVKLGFTKCKDIERIQFKFCNPCLV